MGVPSRIVPAPAAVQKKFLMRRLCLILLLVLLPFQFSWSAAAAYCQHEESTSSDWHFGHHLHQHQASTKADHGKKSVIDTDCGVCHLVSAPIAYGQLTCLDTVEGAEPAPTSRELKLSSSNMRVPDRPQWRRLI